MQAMEAGMARDNWGEVARLGMFIVGVEAVPEAEWWAMAPDGVSVHAARVSAPTPWVKMVDGRAVPAEDIERGTAQLAGLAPAAVVTGHSSSSIFGGEGWDEAVIRALSERFGEETAVTTNGLDCRRALAAMGVERPFLVFPPWFADRALAAGGDYFARHGFGDGGSFRNVPEARWAEVAPSELYPRKMHVAQRADLLRDQIVEHIPDRADGVLMVGTGLRAVGIIAELEDRLGLPVVSANQASLWRCLALAGVASRVEGYGRLFGCDHAD